MEYGLRAFLQWLFKAGGKTEKPAFKSQRDAADFVRRVYNKSNGPNPKLVKMYKNYNEIRREQKEDPDRHQAA